MNLINDSIRNRITQRNFAYILMLLAVFYIIYVVTTQIKIEKNHGLGWDGVFYNAITESLKGNNSKEDEILLEFNFKSYGEAFKKGTPFNQRIGLPLLASLSNANIFTFFTIFNIVSFFLGVVILFSKWIKNNFLVAVLFCFYLILTPQVPFRFTFFYPVNIDGILFLYISLVIKYYRNNTIILLLTIIFLPFKEATILIGGGMFFSKIISSILFKNEENLNKKVKIIIYLIMKILILFMCYFLYKKIITYYFDLELGNHGLKTIIFWMKRNIFKYAFYVKLLACFFVFSSGYWIFYLKKQLEYKGGSNFFVFLITLIPILIFSGSDITRILCISLPFLFDDILELNLTKKDISWLLGCFILFIPLKFPFLTLVFNDKQNIGEGFFLTQPEYLNVKYCLGYIGYSLLILILLQLWQKILFKYDKIS